MKALRMIDWRLDWADRGTLPLSILDANHGRARRDAGADDAAAGVRELGLERAAHGVHAVHARRWLVDAVQEDPERATPVLARPVLGLLPGQARQRETRPLLAARGVD